MSFVEKRRMPMPNTGITVADQLKKIPTAVRPTVQAARKTIKAVAPQAAETAYQSKPPRSKRYLWKILRYASGSGNVAAIGVFPTYATIFFYRGRELDDGSGTLEGGGKQLRFIRLRRPADAERASVRRVVREAFKLGA
jgi:hypothetical protein